MELGTLKKTPTDHFEKRKLKGKEPVLENWGHFGNWGHLRFIEKTEVSPISSVFYDCYFHLSLIYKYL